MSRTMTLAFKDMLAQSSTLWDISTYGGVLCDCQLTEGVPAFRFVDIPGRSRPLDVSRAATGNMAYSGAVHTYRVALIGNDTIANNETAAQNIITRVNGKKCQVNDPFSTYVCECAVTSHERIGEYVMLTITATETS